MGDLCRLGIAEAKRANRCRRYTSACQLQKAAPREVSIHNASYAKITSPESKMYSESTSVKFVRQCSFRNDGGARTDLKPSWDRPAAASNVGDPHASKTSTLATSLSEA
jgi:hypothetical protein